MKKITQILAVATLICALAVPAQASQGLAISPTVVQQTVKQLEIMAGDAKGNMNLSNQVTRAEFATMLVAASPYKNVSTSFGYTLFSDVPSSHWASGYVKVVVEQGYMVGYLNGTFGPSRTVLVEEAVTAVLNLLGYNSASLSGTYPQAQMAKFYELDLDEFMSVSTGQTMTREQCMYLFYNLMNTRTLDGTPYASTMGYATTAAGKLDTMALQNSTTQGPFLVGTAALPSELQGITNIYKNDKQASLSDLQHYDVIYYNEKMNTVWIYDEKITGRLTAIDSVQAPTAVTVAGTTYPLETVDVIHKFSVGGEFEAGDMVTLLMGNQGMVADAVSASQTDGNYIGVVLERGVDQYADGADSTVLSNYIRIATTDGTVRQFDSGNQKFEAGRVVQVSYENGQQIIRGLSTKSVQGKVNQSMTQLGNHKLAEDLEVFEISDAEFGKLYPSRIAGYTLKEDDVRYYQTNSKGEIDVLILEDATGDMSHYVLLTSVSQIDYGLVKSGQYAYLQNGTPGMQVTDTKIYNVKKGGAILQYKDGQLDNMDNLESGKVSAITGLDAFVSGQKIILADNIQVYETVSSGYQKVNINQVTDLGKYNLTAYYDKDLFSAGGQVRILLAELK